MSRLDSDAVRQTDEEFYDNHPDMRGEQLSATDPAQAGLRAEWKALYNKHARKTAPAGKRRPVGSSIAPCPAARADLTFLVVDDLEGRPLQSIPLVIEVPSSEGGQAQYATDKNGKVEFKNKPVDQSYWAVSMDAPWASAVAVEDVAAEQASAR